MKCWKGYHEDIFASLVTPRMFSPKKLSEELARVVHNKNEKFIVEILRTIEPRIADITLAGGNILADVGLSQRLPIQMVGDGIVKLLTTILNIYECRNGVALIDEIDNGLHFSAMPHLWKAVFKTSIDNNVQVFATTHNIDSLKGMTAVASTPEYADSLSAYKLVRGANDELTALRYDAKTFNYMITQEIEVR